MSSLMKPLAVGACALMVLTLAACGGGETEEDPNALSPEAAEEWAWLEETKPEIDALRAEYYEVQEEYYGALPPAADAPEGEGEGEGETEPAEAETPPEAVEGEEGEAAEPLTPEELEAKYQELKAQVEERGAEFGDRLIAFINDQGFIEGELTEIQKTAIRFNSDEALANAREYIFRAGQWRQAIDIYRRALNVDPEYEALQEAIEYAEAMRLMTEDRFARVEKKMTQKEVRTVLGPPTLSNIREFPERNVVGWFFPKENGGAAGVYFRETKKGNENWQVYNADFSAIEPEIRGGEGEETAEAPEG